jgi:predicted dehydrogenase/threonine dehydrogenase-like Zn-dependent dehydrogenase
LKQIAQYQDGRLELQDVPLPTAPPGGILVRLTHSVISVGTEKMKVEQARMNLLQKARARPDQVRKVLDTARTLGWRAAMEKVRNRLEIPSPLGYSAAGIVEAVDTANTRFRVGDRVAIGGAECAFHAEYAAVPDMLAAHVPEGVENWQAAYTTIASISLQAVRQLEPTLGDRVLVVGQGLVGLLVTAFLRASGARVMALDVAPARRALAHAMGAEKVVIAAQQDLRQEVRAWTDGFGIDAAVLAASASSNGPTDQALEVLRDRGRLVVVGKTKVDLPWEYAFGKEIEVRFSRSYGPGRYDPAYEWAGADYPIGYVRWTEQRNFEACLQLMRTGGLNIAALTTRRAPFTQALQVYQHLMGEGAASEAGVILEYGPAPRESDAARGGDAAARVVEAAREGDTPRAAASPRLTLVQAESRSVSAGNSADATATSGTSPPSAATAALASIAARKLDAGALSDPGVPARRLNAPVSRVDVIGAGNFARTMLLPHLKDRIPLGTVVNNTALSASHVRNKFGFAHSATSSERVFSDDASAGVLIATRHNLHAPLVIAALGADRHVFVEKPLCLTRGELAQIDTALAGSQGSVQVGFNRRFAGAATELRNLVRSTPGPKTASFRVMAGALEPTSWFANHTESGGRVLGEACHFFDFLCFLFESRPLRVSAQTVWPAAGRLPFPDSVTAQIEFADGSCGQLVYSAEGDSSWPKEICTVFGAGLTAELENFKTLNIHRKRKRTSRSFEGKGHAEQMAAWTAFLRGESPHPVPFEEARRSMLLTFAAVEALQQGRSIDVEA